MNKTVASLTVVFEMKRKRKKKKHKKIEQYKQKFNSKVEMQFVLHLSFLTLLIEIVFLFSWVLI